MATTKYSLPTLESTALFDLVTDYNALANATDSALASVAGLIPTETITEMQGQISALQTLTGSQGTQITTLQSQISKTNGNISNLQAGLNTANTNIGQLQTGLQSTNNYVSQIKQGFDQYSDYTSQVFDNGKIFTNATGTIVLLRNTSQTIVKIFGTFSTGGNVKRAIIPGVRLNGGQQAYGIKTSIQAVDNRSLTTGYLIQYAGISKKSSGGDYNGTVSFAIGSDGFVYVATSQNSADASAIVENYLLQIPIFLGNPIAYSTVTE